MVRFRFVVEVTSRWQSQDRQSDIPRALQDGNRLPVELSREVFERAASELVDAEAVARLLNHVE